MRSHAPFCSARCKSIDLGKWLGGAYALPAAPSEQEGDGDVPPPPDDDERDD